MERIDLHTHSNASDGTMTPTELIKYAKDKGLKAIALTDHDTIDGIEEAVQASKTYNLEFVPGIEFAADFNGKEFHILAYYIDYRNDYFKQTIKKIQIDRQNRNIEMIELLKKLGFDVDISELYSISGGKNVVTRAHFAKLLLKKGYINTLDEAFKKYLSDGCPAYIPRKILNSKQCIELIIENNAIPVLAHPTLYKMTMHQIELAIKELINYGLKGVESIYPLYTNQQESDLKAIAKKYNIKITGGSDFHGANKPNIDLGTGIGKNIFIPYEILNDLR